MANRNREELGNAPETKARKNLVRWVDREGNSISKLASLAGVRPPSAHSWYWRVSRPSDKLWARLALIIGGDQYDWETPEERKARIDFAKRLEGLSRGAA